MITVGLFFGTFNPIHKGHLAVVNYFSEETKIEEVWLVISPQNPFKNKDEILDNEHRLNMVSLAVDNFPKLKVCDEEFNLPKPSYTINTLKLLKNKFPNYKFILLLGQDNIAHLNEWRDYKDILKHHSIYVYPRAEADMVPQEIMDNQNIQFFNAPKMEISSTEVRKIAKKGKIKSKHVPEKIKNYIKKSGLYL